MLSLDGALMNPTLFPLLALLSMTKLYIIVINLTFTGMTFLLKVEKEIILMCGLGCKPKLCPSHGNFGNGRRANHKAMD
jgi:hypothetical protein